MVGDERSDRGAQWSVDAGPRLKAGSNHPLELGSLYRVDSHWRNTDATRHSLLSWSGMDTRTIPVNEQVAKSLVIGT